MDGLAATYGLLAAGSAVLVFACAFAYMLHHLDQQQRDVHALVPFWLLMMTVVGQLESPLAPSAVEALVTYDWPGNVRELQTSSNARSCARMAES